jgi:hypothetical protein
MFRENPALAPHLLSMLFGIDVPTHSSVRVADTAFDQLVPLEFRADLVLELRDQASAVVLALVLESQREIDVRKTFWRRW